MAQIGNVTVKFTQQGWECPKCGHVYAPFIVQCLKCGPAAPAPSIPSFPRPPWSPPSTSPTLRSPNQCSGFGPPDPE